MPAPIAKKDERISGYSGEKPCEPLFPWNFSDQAAADGRAGVIAGLEHDEKSRIRKRFAFCDFVAIQNLRDAVAGIGSQFVEQRAHLLVGFLVVRVVQDDGGHATGHPRFGFPRVDYRSVGLRIWLWPG